MKQEAITDPAMPVGYRTAVLLVLASGLLNSAGGVFVRSVDSASDLQIVFYRSVSLFVALTLLFVTQHRGKATRVLRSNVKWSLLGGLFHGLASAGLVVSMTHTTIANTSFVLAATPFITACLAWLILGESVRRGTWLAMALALIGIVIMFGDGFAGGRLYGNAMALATAFFFSSFVVVLRLGRANSMLPATMVGAGAAAVLSALLTGGDLSVSHHDLIVCLLWGGALSSVVHALFVFASRFVQGAELTLLILVEFALAPVWVWLLFAEVPTYATLIGGLIVLGTVAGRAVIGMRESQPQ